MEIVSQLTEHHDLSPSGVSREHSAVYKIKAAILDHGNPFAVEGDRRHNMITQAYVPHEFVEQILNANDTGQNMYEDCVTERINGNISIWATVMKVDNTMFMSGKQDNHHQATRQDGRSKGDEGSLWETNDPRKIDQRH